MDWINSIKETILEVRSLDREIKLCKDEIINIEDSINKLMDWIEHLENKLRALLKEAKKMENNNG